MTREILHAIRSLRRAPAFTAVAVLTLALGIGANTALFSLVNAVLLRPLPYVDPERIALLRISLGSERMRPSLSFPEVIEFSERATAFDAFAGALILRGTMVANGEAETFEGARVSGSLTQLLGLPLARGRDFTTEELVPWANRKVALISYALWQRRFGGEESAVGKTIQLDAQDHTIIGILPRKFPLLFPADAGVPETVDVVRPLWFSMSPQMRRIHFLRTVVRIKPGVSLREAQAQIETIAARRVRESGDYDNNSVSFHLVPLHSEVVGSVSPVLLTLLAAVGMVLAIACTNVACLLMARATNREKEIAIRIALGASRARILRQLLTESAVLASLGCGASFLVLPWTIRTLVAFSPAGVPRVGESSLDATVLLFALAATVVTALMFGLLPAVLASRALAGGTQLREGRGSSGPASQRLRSTLMAAEVALSIVLLIGAGLMIRTFIFLQNVQPGFDTANVHTFRVVLPNGRYTPPERPPFFHRFWDKLRELPGVNAVGAVSQGPLSGRYWTVDYSLHENAGSSGTPASAFLSLALPGYLETVGTSFLSGRGFDWNDSLSNRKVALVDETLARRAWPGQSAIGQRIKIVATDPTNWHWHEVVGVVEHARVEKLQSVGREQIYLPISYNPYHNALTFAVRSSLSSAELGSALRRELATMDKDIALAEYETLRGRVESSMAPTRFGLLVLGVLAGFATVLAAVGLYGVIAYSVGQRRREVGIRLALGATPRDVVRMFLRQGAAMVAAGLAAGLILAAITTRAMSSFVSGVSATDTMTFAAVSVLMIVVSFVAILVPARRATRVDPLVALRHD